MKKTVLILAATVLSAVAMAADQVIMAKYNKTCVVCHASGAANAPKTGAVADWTPRMEKGMDVLVASVTTGMKAMPPKGLCYDCSTEDYTALIQYMAAPK